MRELFRIGGHNHNTLLPINRVDELKVDLVYDIRRSQPCKLDQFLKTMLFYILNEDSQEKKDLKELQETLEKLELKIDARLRVKAAEEKAQHAENEAEGE